MTEMSPAFRNVVRITALSGLALLIIGYAVTNKQSPTFKHPPSQDTPLSKRVHKTEIGTQNGVNSAGRTPLGVDLASAREGQASGAQGQAAGVRGQAGSAQVQAGSAHVQARSAHGNVAAPTVSPKATVTKRYGKNHYPKEGADVKPRDTFTPLPDLVAFSLDDSSQPRIPRKPSNPNENEIHAKEFLIPGIVPGVVHYLWCGNRWLGFKQYLALLSAVKAVNPDKIVFHFEFEPQGDQVFYHQWWQDVVHDFPFLYVHRIDDKELDVCHGPPDTRLKRLMSWMDYDGGGVFVSENTWLTDFPPVLRNIDLDYALDPGTLNGYLILRSGIARDNKYSIKSMMDNKTLSTRYSTCPLIKQLDQQKGAPPGTKCVTITGAKIFDFMTPMHVWELDTAFGRMTRKVFYGTEEILRPKPTYDELVPNIGHMIWIGGGRMDFLFYLSLLSKLYVLKVDVVYIHGDMPPSGEYWAKLKNNKRIFDRIKFISRPPPYRMYQGEVQWYYRALMSDLIRVDIMIKYGGIYTDVDAIWTKTLSKEDRGYEAVGSFDWVDWSYPYPDSVNFGLSYGKRNAPFWRIFRESMRTLHNDIHGFTGVMMPYKLLEKYPHLLRIDKHLMAICYNQKCHPTYVADYHNETNNHLTTNSIPNWREDLNALHWTHPNPPEYANETTLMAAKSMFADVGRFVLKSAGLI